MADLTPQELEEFEFRQRLEQEQEQAQAQETAKPSMISKAADYVGPGFVAESIGAGAGALLGPGIKSEVEKYGIPGLKPVAKPPIQVPPSFKSPSQVAEQAIKNRIASVTVEGVPEGAVKNYGLSSQFVNPAGEKVYYGAGQTGDYAGVHSVAKEAIASEKQFPGMKPIQGGTTPFSVPEHVAKELEVLRLQEEAARAANNQAEVNKIAQTRAVRLKAVEDAYAQINKTPGFLESIRTAPLQAARRGVENFGDFLNRSISPHGLATAGSRALGALGGYDVGIQGTEAVKHLSNDHWGRAAVSGLGALGGGLAMTRHPLLMPLGIGAAAAAPFINNYLEGVAAKHPGWHLAEGGMVHMAEGSDVKKPRAGIAGVYQQVGPVKGPSLSSIFAEHIASLPQKTEDNLRQQQDIMDRAFAGDREAMKEFTGMVAGVGGMIKPTSLAELMELIKQRGGIEAAKRLEKAADLVPNLEHQYQPQALKEAFTGNRSIVSVMNPADFEKYAAPISSETKSSLSKSRRIGEPGPGQDYTHMPLGTYDDYINYLQQFSAPGGGGFRSMPYLQLGQRKGFSFPNIQGHEGRHRTDALAKQGNQSTLIGIDPRPELRELPRSSQEEYLNALASEVGGKSPFVMPQESEVKRGLIELPEMFKKGGLV